MPNVWISADLHLWTQEHDSRHPYRSQRQIDELAGTFAQMLRQDDILIFLGDLCDPSASDLNKVAAFVRSIPCTKLMCRGNHDTEDDAYYLEAGFDQVTDLIRMHNIIFSHKPVSVAPDEVNVHAHLHTLKMSNLTAQHINAYGALNGKDIPLILLDDLFAQATLRSINNGEEVLTGKQWEEMHMYVSLDHDHYRNPVDITDLVPLCPVDESGKDTLVRIIEFNNWINQNFTYGLRINGVYDPKRNTTAEDWDKHLIVQSPKQIEKTRVGVCWDYTSYEAWYFKKNFTGVTVTAWYIVYGLKPDCPTHTFLTFEYEGNYYYFDSSFSDVAGVWAADNEKDIINFVIDSMMKHDPRLINEVKRSNFGLFKYDPLDEELFGLGCVDYMQWMVEEADEIKHRYNPSYKIPVKMNAVLEAVIKEDILDEVLFQDSEDVKYWMTDDKTYRKKADKGEESDKSVAAIDESTNPYATKWNDRVLYYVSAENMDDELYPVGKCLWETVPRAAFYCALGRDNPAGHGEFWVHAIEPGYYQLRSSVEEFGAWWSVDQINLNTVGKVKVFIGDDGETYMDWMFKYVDGVAVECNPDGTFKDTTGQTLQETSMASTLEKGHQQNGRMSLSSLKRITIDEGKRKELSNSYGFLKHFYGNDEWHQTVGWLDRKGNLVAAICVSKPDKEYAGQMWLTDFEIVKEYRGYGLSKQILDYACKSCGADALGVAKDNKIARKVYEDYGFKYGNQVHKQDKAGTNRLMYLPESVIMVDPNNIELVNKMTAIGYTWADWKNRGHMQPMVLQEMAYEDAADLMRRRLGHYCKEFNSGSQFEQIEKVWKKNWPGEKPPKLSAYMEVSSDNQLCFNLAHEINTDSDDGLKKVVTYTKIMHDLRKRLEKDKDVKDCAYIVGMYDLVEDGVLLYVNLKGIDAFSADSPEVYWPDVTAFEQPRENENDYVSHDGVKVVFENDKHVKIGEVSISGTATDEPYLYDLEVYPRYRGKKYGNAIMRYVMQKYKPTELCVEWKNEIAQKLYERFGFKKDSIIEDYRTTLIVMRTTRKHTGSFKSNEESISESTINENFVGTVPDFEWHRDEWAATGKNFLFICGLSGGGKTTLANEISKETNCEVIHLDDLAQAAFVGKIANPDFRKRMSPTMQAYWNSTTKHIKMYAWGDQRLALETENFIQWMIKNHAKDGRLYIIEGCEIMYMDADYLIDQPLIIKGTSAIRTTFWRFKRTYGQHRTKGEDALKAFEHCMLQIMKIYKNGAMIAAENGLMRFKAVLQAARDYNEFVMTCGNTVKNPAETEIVSTCGSLADVKKVVKELSDADVHHIYEDGFKEWPNVLYRRVYYRNSKPLGFIDVFTFPEEPHDAYVAVAVVPDERRNGLSYRMLSDFVAKRKTEKNLQRYNVNALIDNDNSASIEMSTKFGFKLKAQGDRESTYVLSEAVVETHPMDRDEKKRVAEKYGIRPVGQTHDEADKDEAIEKQKELDRKKKERLKQLEKGRNTQKRNRVIKKIKSHLPGAKNEGAGSDEDDAFYLTDGQNTESGSLLGDHIEVFKDPKQFEEIVDEAISGYRFELLDHVQFFDRLDENAVTDKVFHPVYVVLMHTGSLVATAIKTATNCEFSHVSIAFDSGLKPMFSFGGHKVGPNGEPQHSGFKKESLDDNFFKDRKVPYAIYAVPCTKGQLAKMKKRLDYFVKNENKFYFDFTGLIKNFFGVSDNPQNRWFCSRFVSDILNSGTPNDPLVKDPSLMRPEDFKSVDFAFRVDSGEDLRKINSKKIDRATKTAFKTVSIKRAAVTEGAMHLYPDNPYEKQVLMYQLSMMGEGAIDGFIQYLQSFKIRVDGNGNILITRREFDQLDSHFRQSMKMIKSFETAGNVQGVKDELCKIHYMIELINQYYLREDVKNLKPTAKDVRKDMLDLRSVMLNVFKQHLGWVTQRDSKWNFQRYYDNSKYGKNVTIPNKVVTAVGRTIITALA